MLRHHTLVVLIVGLTAAVILAPGAFGQTPDPAPTPAPDPAPPQAPPKLPPAPPVPPPPRPPAPPPSPPPAPPPNPSPAPAPAPSPAPAPAYAAAAPATTPPPRAARGQRGQARRAKARSDTAKDRKAKRRANADGARLAALSRGRYELRKSEGVLGTAVTASFGTIRAAPSVGTTDRFPSRHLLLLLILPLVALGVAAMSPTVLQVTTPTRALIAHRESLALAGLAGLLGALAVMLIVFVFS